MRIALLLSLWLNEILLWIACRPLYLSNSQTQLVILPLVLSSALLLFFTSVQINDTWDK